MSSTAVTRILLPLIVALGVVTLGVLGYFELVSSVIEYLGYVRPA